MKLGRLHQNAMQMEAGIGNPIMENCCQLDYIEWGWIQLIRDYLQHINGHISIGNRKKQLLLSHGCAIPRTDHTTRTHIHKHMSTPLASDYLIRYFDSSWEPDSPCMV
jgi:hypothetical protein